MFEIGESVVVLAGGPIKSIAPCTRLIAAVPSANPAALAVTVTDVVPVCPSLPCT